MLSVKIAHYEQQLEFQANILSRDELWEMYSLRQELVAELYSRPEAADEESLRSSCQRTGRIALTIPAMEEYTVRPRLHG